jgi:putative flippase GtrA
MSELTHRYTSKLQALLGRFSPSTNTFVRFLIAGGINTLFGFMVYAAAISLAAAAWLALLIGNIAGIAFNFFTTGGYVFRQLSASRLPRFVLCYLLVYVANLALLQLLVAWTGNKLASQLALAVPVAILSYTLMAQIVFTGRAATPPKTN